MAAVIRACVLMELSGRARETGESSNEQPREAQLRTVGGRLGRHPGDDRVAAGPKGGRRPPVGPALKW